MLESFTDAATPSDARSADPVFVLCLGRSGSTLLRFVLDAHPDLACPPESRLPALCAQLAAVWQQLESLPSSPQAQVSIALAGEVSAGMRRAFDAVTAPYLARRGKRRYCDKSLGTAEHATLLAEIFPTARFICLYRHPMDVIASGLEATPWGLTGFGFDGYAVGSPGNTVLALARYWADHASAIQRFEERHPDRCHRIRYEDLVTDPQGSADLLFDSLGIARVENVAARCFSDDRERHGPSDYKIWHTSTISEASVGRGWRLPAHLIDAHVTGRVNRLAESLGYLPVDSRWGAAASAPDMRTTSATTDLASAGATAASGPGAFTPAYHLIAQCLHAGLFRLDEDFARRWHPSSNDTFTLTAHAPSPSGSDLHSQWRIDLPSRGIATASNDPTADAGHATWGISGPADVWAAVLTGKENFGLALRARRLRYCHTGDAQPVLASLRTAMAAELLGITSWTPQDCDTSTTSNPATAYPVAGPLRQ